MSKHSSAVFMGERSRRSMCFGERYREVRWDKSKDSKHSVFSRSWDTDRMYGNHQSFDLVGYGQPRFAFREEPPYMFMPAEYLLIGNKK